MATADQGLAAGAHGGGELAAVDPPRLFVPAPCQRAVVHLQARQVVRRFRPQLLAAGEQVAPEMAGTGAGGGGTFLRWHAPAIRQGRLEDGGCRGRRLTGCTRGCRTGTVWRPRALGGGRRTWRGGWPGTLGERPPGPVDHPATAPGRRGRP